MVKYASKDGVDKFIMTDEKSCFVFTL